MPKGVYIKSNEHKRKLSKINKGKKLSVEHKMKISKSASRIILKRKEKLGYILSPETRSKISKKLKITMKGEKNPNWRGGISFEPYGFYWTDYLRESIRKRDNHICQECGIHQDELNNERLKKLDIHHIDYDKENCNPYNLITLCRSCHIKTNINRDYWINYFNI